MTPILVALISALGVVVAAALPLMLKQNRVLGQVREQVKNGHHSNLRDDIDKIKHLVEHGFSTVHHRIDLLQTDLSWERRERMDAVQALTGVRPLG